MPPFKPMNTEVLYEDELRFGKHVVTTDWDEQEHVKGDFKGDSYDFCGFFEDDWLLPDLHVMPRPEIDTDLYCGNGANDDVGSCDTMVIRHWLDSGRGPNGLPRGVARGGLRAGRHELGVWRALCRCTAKARWLSGLPLRCGRPGRGCGTWRRTFADAFAPWTASPADAIESMTFYVACHEGHLSGLPVSDCDRRSRCSARAHWCFSAGSQLQHRPDEPVRARLELAETDPVGYRGVTMQAEDPSVGRRAHFADERGSLSLAFCDRVRHGDGALHPDYEVIGVDVCYRGRSVLPFQPMDTGLLYDDGLRFKEYIEAMDGYEREHLRLDIKVDLCWLYACLNARLGPHPLPSPCSSTSASSTSAGVVTVSRNGCKTSPSYGQGGATRGISITASGTSTASSELDPHGGRPWRGVVRRECRSAPVALLRWDRSILASTSTPSRSTSPTACTSTPPPRLAMGGPLTVNGGHRIHTTITLLLSPRAATTDLRSARAPTTTRGGTTKLTTTIR